MIVDKISIVKLEMLSNIENQLAKACGLSNSSTAVFRGPPIIIIIENFYQFPFIAGRSLWGEPQTDKDYNGKILWLFFSLVIILT